MSVSVSNIRGLYKCGAENKTESGGWEARVSKVLFVKKVGRAGLIEKVIFGQRLKHRKGVKRGFQDERTVKAVQSQG